MLPFALVCGGKGDAVARVPTLVPLIKSEGVVAPQPVDLRTVHAQDLRRARDQHSALISLIPTATSLPTRVVSHVAAQVRLGSCQPS